MAVLNKGNSIMTNRKKLLTGVSLAAVLTAGLLYATDFLGLQPFAETATAAPTTGEAAPPTVNVIVAESRPVTHWQEFTGRFEAVDEVAVRARVEGQIDAVHFTPGQIVQKGDLLFTIDPRPFEATLAGAEARLEEVRAAAYLAETELKRQRQLRENGHVSQSVLDQAVQEAQAARASIAAAKAAVESAKLNLEFTEIKAPVTGRISDDAVNVGNLIAAGANSEVLTTIVSLDPIHFVFDASEQQYLEYVRGTIATGLRDKDSRIPVAVRLIDEDSFAHPGTIDFIDNRIDRATGTIRGRAIFVNGDEVLAPGMFGRLRLAIAENAPTVLIPEQAVGSDQTLKFVWVADAEGVVHRRRVTLGGREDGLRIIEKGLEAGDQVIVSSLHMIGEGMTITPNKTALDSFELATAE